jgi:hypothetical protein
MLSTVKGGVKYALFSQISKFRCKSGELPDKF